MDADVIVVGAGLAGLVVTRKLTRPGAAAGAQTICRRATPRLGTSDTATRPGNTGSVVVQRN
jgi:cation diffusion facilitator CzcD-associated flavoprotein CzcO